MRSDGRVDMGMAGYVTDREVMDWRNARHPLRYDPPRWGCKLASAALGAMFGVALIAVWWSLYLVTPSWCW